MTEALIKRLDEEVNEAKVQIEVLADHELDCEQDYLDASELLKQVKGKIKFLEEERKLTVKPMNDQVKEINAWFKPAVDRLEQIEKRLKKMIGDYTIKQHQEQARLLAAAAAEAKAAVEARSVTESGPLVPVDIQEKLEAAQAAAAPRVAGISVSEVWAWELLSEKEVPVQYKSVDKRKIDEAMKNGVRDIPGVRFFQTSKVVARS